MGQPAARISDNHVCPMATPGTPPIPHVGGPIVMGSPNVLTGNMPQARISDTCTCVGPPDLIAKASVTVHVNKMPAARMGDSTAHGGVIATGFPSVLIGDGGGGGPAGAGGSGGGKAVVATVSDFLLSAEALTEAGAQARTLIKAAKNGTPFCERCAAAAAAASR